MGYIREYIESITSLSEQDWLLISSFFERRELDKGYKLITLGETERYLSFIEKGIVRYYIPGEEKELTFGFSFDKEFTCAYDSFLTRLPTEYEQETLKKPFSGVFRIPTCKRCILKPRTATTGDGMLPNSCFFKKAKGKFRCLNTPPKKGILIYCQVNRI